MNWVAMWDVSASVCLLISFFLIAPEVVRPEMLDRMTERVLMSLVNQYNWLNAGVIVLRLDDAPGRYDIKIERVDTGKMKAMLSRWALFLLPLGGGRFVTSVGLSGLAFSGVAFLRLFNKWACWENDARGWAIAVGMLCFVYGSTAHIGLAAGRL